jgi:membrane-bound ClpP family serine protease
MGAIHHPNRRNSMATFNLIKAFQDFWYAEVTGSVVTDLPQKFRPNTLEGEAIVSATILPRQPGRVRFQGTWWPARCEQELTLLAGEVVYVVGRENITLLVQPIRWLEADLAQSVLPATPVLPLLNLSA